MKVSKALDSRLSVRDFLDTPVEAQVVREIITKAGRAPSGGNLQPWHVYAMAGEPLQKLLAEVALKAKGRSMGEGSQYNIYPPRLKEPYRSRRSKVAEDMYGKLGIARDNRKGRLEHFMRNYQLFGAPVALFFAIDRQMQEGQWADLGMFMQSIMLLAREYGLHTCPQEAWALWFKTVGKALALPETLMLFCGMGLGYMNENAKVNTLRSERAPLEEYAHFIGL